MRDVALPVTSGIIIIVIVFLPLLTLEGLEGKLFGPVTLTIVFALLGSLVLSLTLIPVVASFFVGADAHDEPWLSRKLTAIYSPLLTKALQRPKFLLIAAGVLLAASVVVFPLVGKTFMPTMDEGDILIQLETIPSISLDANIRVVQQVERALRDNVPEILRVVSRIGSDEMGMDPMGLNETDIFLQLRPQSEWRMATKAELEETLREVMDQFVGLNYGFTQHIDMRVSEMLTGSRGDLAIKLFGSDLTTLNETAQEISALIETIPGAIDTIATIKKDAQYLQITVGSLLRERLNLNADDLQLRT